MSDADGSATHSVLPQVRQRQAREPFWRRGLEIVPVHPCQLVDVEHARAVTHVLQTKPRRELLDRNELLTLTRRPSDQREVIRQCLRQISASAELRHRRRTMTLGQRTVIGPHHQRHMRERRWSPAERFEDQNLARRVRDVILTSNHMRDLHQRIVDDDSVVVGGDAVGSNDDGIANHFRVERHAASNHVIERDVTVVGHAKANHRFLAVLDATPCVVARDLTAPADVLRRSPCGQCRRTIGLEQLRRAETLIRMPAGHQLHGMRAIDMQALGLTVRTTLATNVHALGPLEAEPMQVVDHAALGFARGALEVGVLDSQDERATLPAREQPVEERRARVADVQLPGRARSETESHQVFGPSALSLVTSDRATRRRGPRSTRPRPLNLHLRLSCPLR